MTKTFFCLLDNHLLEWVSPKFGNFLNHLQAAGAKLITFIIAITVIMNVYLDVVHLQLRKTTLLTQLLLTSFQKGQHSLKQRTTIDS